MGFLGFGPSDAWDMLTPEQQDIVSEYWDQEAREATERTDHPHGTDEEGTKVPEGGGWDGR